jgi:hypothetical protein
MLPTGGVTPRYAIAVPRNRRKTGLEHHATLSVYFLERVLLNAQHRIFAQANAT